jgi:alanine dehydrogenase
MQILDAQSVADALPYGQLIEALRDAFAGDVDVPLRAHHDVPVPGGTDGTLLLMPAWQAGRDMGVKIATVFPDNALRSLPAVHASYFLMNGTSGVPEAVLDGTELTVRRTAAASALASGYLSREDASTLLMVGTGNLAPCLVEAHAAVRPIREVVIWGRRREAAEQLSARIAPLSMSVTIADDLETAAREADIISCATLSPDPLIHGDWLSGGQHVDLVGAFRPDMREADSVAMAKARVYVDTLAGALTEAGEIVQAIDEGALTENDICGELSTLTRGQAQGRTSADQLTLFKSVGTALEDLAAARLAISNQAS